MNCIRKGLVAKLLQNCLEEALESSLVYKYFQEIALLIT